MRKFVAVGSMVALGLVVGRLALADDESDRAELIKNIDDKVEDVGDELSGFESDSDVGDLDDALSYAREVKDLVGRLERVQGDDSRARDIVSNYPGYVDQFRDAARYLKKMKEVQRLADGVADRCTSDESSLQSTIRGYVGQTDVPEEAFTKLPELGQAYGKTWGEKLDKLEESDKEMQQSAGYARFSVSDHEWSGVSSSFGYAASGIQSYWNERVSAARTACKRLALGDKHPDIEKALEELAKRRGGVKATVTQLKKDYNEWLRDVRKLRKFSDEDRDAIRDVICTAGEYEMEAKINEVADRWASQISGVYGTTMGTADHLKARANALSQWKGPRKVLEDVDKNVANLEKLKGYELLGSNNPLIRTKIEWGKKRHLDLQGSCAVSELEIDSGDCTNEVRPGSGCRLDCFKDCTIIEFKPNSTGAEEEGRKQLSSYSGGLQRWYERDKAQLFEKYGAVRDCENSDKTALTIKTALVTYEFCTSTVRNEIGQVLDEATLDVVEDGE